ncbi:phage holin family protein [Actinoplanes sp. CA-142083]|uniref:phage holin family protein n=1 Tax=Actinoplanes sp. CA-142083 TaxID=3239903 RepID=UPI003D94D1DA
MATHLVQELTDQATALVREELASARTEMATKGKRAAIGAGLFGAAGAVAVYGIGALAVTVAAALALIMPVWTAVLITAVLLFAGAGAAALTGKGQITKPLPEEAMASGRRDVEAVKDAVRAHALQDRSGRERPPARR